MYPAHLPLLYVVNVRIGQVKQPLRKMADDRFSVQEFLVVKTLREQFLFGRAADKRALVRKDKFLCLYQFPRLSEDSRLPALLHIEQQHARIYIVWADKELPVVIPRGGIFDLGDIGIVQQQYVAVRKDIGIEVQEFFRHLRNKVGKQAQQRVRGAVAAFVRAAAEFRMVQLRDVDFFDAVSGIVFLDDRIKEGNLPVGKRPVVAFQLLQVHRKNKELERLCGLRPFKKRKRACQYSVKNLVISAKKNMNHTISR